MKTKSSKILIFDIETAPNLAYVWGKYEQDVIDLKRSWHMLSFSAKWLGDKNVITYGLPDFPAYKRNKYDDRFLCKELWKLFDQADVIIAHNGDEFDIKKSNALFIQHGFKPPSPYKTIDTKKVAKKYFKFDSNKLDDLGKYLHIGRKLKHGGFDLWLGCMSGDKSSWKTMIEYNTQDVLLLEEIYLAMLPWMTNHPNRNLLDNSLGNCKNCGSNHLQKRGFSITETSKKQRYQCQSCGAWGHGKPVAVKGLLIR